MPHQLRTAFLLACACLPCVASTARDLFVNNTTGGDQANGLSASLDGENGPMGCIGRALYLARPGDHIVIAKTDQPYREQLSISGRCLHGEEGSPLLISGNGATLDGTVIAADGAWRHAGGDVFAMRPRRLTFQQLFLEGSPLERVRLASAANDADALRPLQWALADGQILFRVERNRLPQAYDLRHTGLQTGVTLYNTRHVVIEDLVIQGFQQDGINAHELVRDCVLRRVECRANGRSGLSVGGVSRVRVEDSGFYDNGVAQVRVEGLGHLSLEGCELDDAADALPYEIDGGGLTIDGRELAAE